MKKSTLSLAIGLLLACSTGMAKTQHLTLEQRMALLEERLEAGRNAGSKSREPG
ncbi:putative porin [Escherichia coli]|uniref:Putative porin n=1 Tax=Escherichia coli TaxID=562 RepID=A0A376LFE1_ECOLX|nr:putative porin [Escherichia coli]